MVQVYVQQVTQAAHCHIYVVDGAVASWRAGPLRAACLARTNGEPGPCRGAARRPPAGGGLLDMAADAYCIYDDQHTVNH
jgi:hypothetical protein